MFEVLSSKIQKKKHYKPLGYEIQTHILGFQMPKKGTAGKEGK